MLRATLTRALCALLLLAGLVAACSGMTVLIEPEEPGPPPGFDQPLVPVREATVRNGAGKVILAYDRANGEQVPPDFDITDYDGAVTVDETLEDGSKFKQVFDTDPGESFILRYRREYGNQGRFELKQAKEGGAGGLNLHEVEGD